MSGKKMCIDCGKSEKFLPSWDRCYPCEVKHRNEERRARLLSDEETEVRDTYDIVCPWCGHIHRNAWDFPDEGEHDCDSCEKMFEFEAAVTRKFTTTRVVIPEEDADDGSKED